MDTSLSKSYNSVESLPKSKRDVFTELYENNRPSFRDRNHRFTDVITSDERLYQENCTFKPVIEHDCPFVSERTLRDYAIRSRKRRPPPPPSSRSLNTTSRSRSPLKRTYKNDLKYQKLLEVVESTTSMGGMYDIDLGFRKGPPLEVGLQIYYFDAENPPEFDNGKYLVRVESVETSISDNMIEEFEEQEVIDEESDIDELRPPPLPIGGDGDSNSGTGGLKSVVLKIIKSNKEKTDHPGLTGWQAVMEEMRKKKEAMFGGGTGLKKVEISDNSKQKGKPSKKKKKKKGEFKDVMDELSYKLAKLRGEVAESETDDDDTADITSAKEVKKSSNSDENSKTITKDDDEPSTTSLSKLPSKKNMMDLLSAITKPKDDKGKTSTAPVTKTPASILAGKLSKDTNIKDNTNSATTLSASEKAPIAFARPNIVPAPPPIPSVWPPVPYLIIEAVKTVEIEKKSVIKMKKVRVLVKKPAPPQLVTVYKDELKDLPTGYYMPAPVNGMVGNKQILPGSLTTAEQCESMKLVFFDIAENKRKQLFNDTSYGSMEIKTDYSYQVDDDDDDEYSVQDELNIEKLMKDKLTISDLPLPPDFHAAIQRLQKSTEMRHEVIEKQKDLELRNFLYYETIFDKNIHVAAIESATKKLEITIPKPFKSHVNELNDSKSFSHRKMIPHSNEDMLPRCQRIPDTFASAYTATVSSNLSPCDVYWMQNLRSPENKTSNTNNVMNKSSLSTIQHSNKSYNMNNIDNEELLTSGAKYFSNYRPNTEPKCFKLLSDDVLERRKREKEQKEYELKILQESNNNKLKMKKEKMKLKAMRQAQEIGAYKSPTRYNYHQKVLEKYNLQPEIGKINLEKDIKNAYQYYNIQHQLLSPSNDLLYTNNNRDSYNIANIKQKYDKDYRYILDLQKEFDDYQYDGEQLDFNKKYINS